MISDLIVRPKPSNKNAYRIFFAILLLTVGAIGVSYVIPHYRGILQFTGVLLLCTALLVYLRYISASYSYEITTADDTPLFVVRQQTGKKITTLCRVALADVVSVTVEDRAAARAHKTPDGYRRYCYTPSIAPARQIRLIAANRYEKAELLIEADDAYLAILNADIEEARAERAANPDEED